MLKANLNIFLPLLIILFSNGSPSGPSYPRHPRHFFANFTEGCVAGDGWVQWIDVGMRHWWLCRRECLDDPSCNAWQYHASWGCWLDLGATARNTDSSLAASICRYAGMQGWKGEKGRATVANEGKMRDCCPGRWCCAGREGGRGEGWLGCCPPRRTFPLPWVQRTAGENGVQLTAEKDKMEADAGDLGEASILQADAESGLLWSCDGRVDVGGGELPVSINLMDAAMDWCEVVERQNEEECFKDAIWRGISSEFLGKDSGDRQGSKSLTYTKNGGDCHPRVDMEGWGRARTRWQSELCKWQRPEIAFRWLGDEGGGRHRRGEVMVSHTWKTVYVNVPKTGSSSVKSIIFNHAGQAVWHELGRSVQETYLVFAFVRDPFKRYLSAYHQVNVANPNILRWNFNACF